MYIFEIPNLIYMWVLHWFPTESVIMDLNLDWANPQIAKVLPILILVTLLLKKVSYDTQLECSIAKIAVYIALTD